MTGKLLIVTALISSAALILLLGCAPKDARSLFESECTKCHTFKGIGSGIIDLSNVTTRRSDTWIKDQIIDARRHDPNSGMPRFGFLPEKQIDELIEFLHSTPKK